MYTYHQAYDKIIEAYFKDEIKPFVNNFCFCGTLAGGIAWKIDKEVNGYSSKQFGEMEAALLDTITLDVFGKRWIEDSHNSFEFEKSEKYEDALFSGMCAALEVLKTIHRERGEDVDGDVVAFTKRELVKEIVH